MKTRYLIVAVLAGYSLVSNAYTGDSERGEMQRSRIDGIRAEMFAEFKGIESWSHKERVRILNEAEHCIQAATDRDQYKACEKQEKASREAVQDQVKSRHQALRAKAEGVRQGMVSRN